MTNISELRSQIAEFDNKISEEKKRHKSELNALTIRRGALNNEYKMALNGVDVDKIRIACEVMYIRGIDSFPCGDDRSAVEDAILWFSGIVKPYKDLNKTGLGTKNYDRWCHQREDCNYGCGPGHGSIVFQIGLNKEFRNKVLSQEQKDACIYYLEMLKAGKLNTNQKEAA